MGIYIISLIFISLKSIAIYIFIVAAIRLFGKKELAQLSVVDLVFILLISNSVQNAMVGNNGPVIGGMAAATGLFVVNYVFKFILKRFPDFGRAIQGSEIMLVYKGKVIPENLDKSMVTMDELNAAIREHGINGIEEADLVILEADGNISVLSKDFTHRTLHRRKAHKVISKNT